LGEKNTGLTRSRVLLIVTSAFTAGFLVWSLRDFKLAMLLDDLRTMNWWWVGLAIVSDIAVYVCQAARWSLLLHPVEPVPIRQTVRAIYVGLFGNEVLGFNAGEVVRTYLISRWTSLPFSVSLSSALIERMFDGFWLCVAMFVTLRIVPRPHHARLLAGSAYVLAGIVLVGALLLVLAMIYRHRARALLAGNSWKRHLRVLIDDLSLIGHSRYLYFSFVLSLLYLLLQVLPIYASFRAYGFDELHLKAAFATAVVLRMGSAVPQAPGNIGLYLLMRQALVNVFRVYPRDAENFAVVFWGILALRLVIGGVIAITVSGTKFGELRRAAHVEREELARSRE
jgi:glycosyltransferase 2 family protein